MSEFHNQGPVPIDSPAYVPRGFEELVFQETIAGRWVLLLGPRQHGKSTSLIRLRQRFEEAGLLVGKVDLQGLPPANDFADLLRYVSEQLRKSLGAGDFQPPTAREHLLSWLEAVIPPGQEPIVITVDEAASISNDNYRNAFYGQIRQIRGQQAEAKGNTVQRLRFIFSGTFRPETLVQEQNSPFNVCQLIRTEDLSIEQARQLASNVHDEIDQFVDQAFALVGGQPFLLQTIFLETMRDPDDLQDSFTKVLRDLRHIAAKHLEGVFSKVIADHSLVDKVAAIIRDGRTRLVPADSECSFLQTIGLAEREGSNLIFRNQFYYDEARSSPQLVIEPARPIANVQVFRLEKSSLDFMNNPGLREVAFSAYDGGANAHNHGNYRLALVGFGSAMEALLIDLIIGIDPAKRNAAIAAARPNFDRRFEDQNDALTWRLVNLIKVGRRISVGATTPEPTDALREWRNLVHPALAIQHYVDESMLAPESVMASALFTALVRDIS